MSIEELLRPRFEVVADYPNNPWEVGTIFTYDKDQAQILTDRFERGIYKTIRENSPRIDSMVIAIGNIGKYPHIFKPCPWWQHRDIKDMPEYVKVPMGKKVFGIDNSDVFKVDTHFYNKHKDCFIAVQDGRAFVSEYNKFQPATQAEYEECRV